MFSNYASHFLFNVTFPPNDTDFEIFPAQRSLYCYIPRAKYIFGTVLSDLSWQMSPCGDTGWQIHRGCIMVNKGGARKMEVGSLSPENGRRVKPANLERMVERLYWASD
jgi:hypothetical protein